MALLTNFAQRAALANDGTFQAQVGVAITQAAGAICAEGPVGDPSVHAKRVALGVQVLTADPFYWTVRFARAVASDAANITTDAPGDTAITTSISSWWNHLAGADV